MFWRFVQGLLLPPIFTVAVAYIGEEWPPHDVPSVIALYTAGAALGGFLGRFLAGLAAGHFGWHAAFVTMAAVDLAGALLIARYLPRESRFVATESLAVSLRGMALHLRNPRLLATFAAGFAILFVFVATFTYVNFHLAGEPFGLSPAALGGIFAVYLFGVVVTPMSGRAVARFGRRRVGAAAIALWAAATALTLAPWLPTIIAGLAVGAACGFVVVALANGFLATVTGRARSVAVGPFATFYYVGGGIGGLLPAPAYAAAGWPGVVALVLAMFAAMGAAVSWAWRERPGARL